MAQFVVNSSGTGSQLNDLLMENDILPGEETSYQVCKTIYEYHPLGRKLAEAPVSLAQSQERQITCPDGPEDRVVKAFKDEWERIGADKLIANVRILSRIYGIASVAVLVDGLDPMKPMDLTKIWEQSISFNVLDPLNTAGSLVMNQNPNAMDFQKHANITIAGKPYARNRSCTVLNEEPIYISYTNSAFGFVGRSTYQRILYPLKSFVNMMIADDMIARKLGVLIAKQKAPGSIIDNLMAGIAGIKRGLLQQAQTDNVLSIDLDEEIETLNMQNVDGAGAYARTNIIKNCATGADMPAVMLLNETLAEGFGEGTEDAKQIAHYVDRERAVMQPLYVFFDDIVQHRAWNPHFYAIIQKDFPDEYGGMQYEEAFYRWKNSFAAVWPNLLTEPDSEKIRTQDVVFKAAIAATEVMLPAVDPENKVRVIQWLADNLNANKLLFPEPLELDYDALENYTPPAPEMQEPGSDGDVKMNRADSAMRSYADAVAHLPVRVARKR